MSCCCDPPDVDLSLRRTTCGDCLYRSSIDVEVFDFSADPFGGTAAPSGSFPTQEQFTALPTGGCNYQFSRPVNGNTAWAVYFADCQKTGPSTFRTRVSWSLFSGGHQWRVDLAIYEGTTCFSTETLVTHGTRFYDSTNFGAAATESGTVVTS